MSHLSPVTVVGNQVGGSAAGIGDGTGGTKGFDTGLDSRWGGDAFQRNEVSGDTSDVRAGHGSSADGPGRSVASDPSGEDILSRCEDVNDGAVVRARGATVVVVDGADGDGEGLVGGRGVGRVLVAVAGSDDDGDPCRDGCADCGVRGG